MPIAIDSTTLSHIVVNIRGPGIANVVFFEWDKKCGSSGTACGSPPSEIVLMVPAGSSRLIQYLGVYQSPGSSGMTFTYGETLRNLNPGVNAVTIATQSFGNPAINRIYNAGGRYLTSYAGGVGSGPTGKVALEFSPPSGSAPMVVGYDEMINGWFDFFGVEGVPISYRLVNSNQTLPALSYNALEAKIAEGSNAVMRGRIPAHFFELVCSGTSCAQRDVQSRDFFVGFFGPGVSAVHKTCYPDSEAALNLTIGYNTTVSLYTDSSKTAALGWSTTTSSGQIHRLGGGSPLANCNGTTYSDNLILDLRAFSGGGDQVAPLRGVFQTTTQTYSSTLCEGQFGGASGCYDNNMQVMTIKAQLLPGVLSTPLSGVTLYTKIVASCDGPNGDCYQEFRDEDSGYRCAELAGKGFVSQGDSTSTNVDFSFNQTAPSAGQKLLMILCPFQILASGQRVIFKLGTEVDFRHNGGT